MSKLLLLVQSEADVAHLEAAARAVLGSAITGVWCVFSPAITVNASEAASKLDGEIAQLRTAERAAADRADYEAAAGYKGQREGKELDKAKALRDAWKTAPEEDRKARVSAIFKPFFGLLQPKGINVKITGHSDHYDREQWVQMLNSLTGAWFKEFSAGGFIVGWPESVETAIPLTGTERWAVAAKAVESTHVAAQASEQLREKMTVTNESRPASRRHELEAMHHMSLRPIAKELGIEPLGKTTAQIIDAILDREAKPETVEAY